MLKLMRLVIVTRNNIVWKLARGYCLCYCKIFSLVPDSTKCTKKIFVTIISCDYGEIPRKETHSRCSLITVIFRFKWQAVM